MNSENVVGIVYGTVTAESNTLLPQNNAHLPVEDDMHLAD